MKMNILIPLLFIIFGMVGTGCTVLFGIAGGSAAGKPMKSDGESFKAGTGVVVSLNDGEQVRGSYTGIEHLLDGDYLSRYAEAKERLKSEIPLPAFGEQLTLNLYPDSVLEDVSFRGFGGYMRTFMIVETDIEGEQIVPVELVVRVTGEGGWESSGIEYRRAAIRGELPARTSVLINRDAGLVRYPTDDITKIARSSSGASVGIGFLAGLATDIIFWKLIARDSFGTVHW